MVMTGEDGNERVVFHLNRVDDRPVILLNDHERTRMSLGFYANDSPDPLDEDWGLRFLPPHSDHFLSGVGMHRVWNDNRLEGFVYAFGKDGYPRVEPKP